jgi:hypothetical protein
MTHQNEEIKDQIDVEVGIDGDAADLMGTKEEAATGTYPNTAESEMNTSERTKGGMSKKMMNSLASSDDPFAVREGKTLLWTNVNMLLVSQLSSSNDVAYI